jgi:hypothetical protein
MTKVVNTTYNIVQRTLKKQPPAGNSAPPLTFEEVKLRPDWPSWEEAIFSKSIHFKPIQWLNQLWGYQAY